MNLKVFIALLLVGVLGGSGAGYLVLQQQNIDAPAVATGDSNSEKPGVGSDAGGAQGGAAAPNAQKFKEVTSLEGLKVGDCIAETMDFPIEDATVVPCTQQHAMEIVGMHAIDGKYIGEKEFEVSANDTCLVSLLDYMGELTNKSPIRFFRLPLPGKPGVNPNAVVCTVGEEAGSSSRSLKGLSL